MQIHEFYPNFISLISIPSAASSRGYRNRQLQGRRGSSERKFDSCAILSVVVPSNRMQSARARGHWNRKPSMRPSRWPAWRQPPPACLRLTDTTHIRRGTRFIMRRNFIMEWRVLSRWVVFGSAKRGVPLMRCPVNRGLNAQ